jgi:hypothetical protein
LRYVRYHLFRFPDGVGFRELISSAFCCSVFKVHLKDKNGAGEGNRTLIISLEG